MLTMVKLVPSLRNRCVPLFCLTICLATTVMITKYSHLYGHNPTHHLLPLYYKYRQNNTSSISKSNFNNNINYRNNTANNSNSNQLVRNQQMNLINKILNFDMKYIRSKNASILSSSLSSPSSSALSSSSSAQPSLSMLSMSSPLLSVPQSLKSSSQSSINEQLVSNRNNNSVNSGDKNLLNTGNSNSNNDNSNSINVSIRSNGDQKQLLLENSDNNKSIKSITKNNSTSIEQTINSNSIIITPLKQNQPKQQNEPKPKPSFNAEDLKATESMKIDKPLMCDNDFGVTRDLVVIVTSAVPNFDARKAVRQTWGKFAVERGAPLLFMIGDTVDNELQEKVYAEDKKYEDILQGSFIDNYYNLTLKTITMMRLASERCSKVKYLLKVDDDVIVNMQQVVDFCETKTFSKSIIGKLAKKWKPHRDLRNKWYVPKSAYKGKMFPYFATGPAYLISGDALRPLYEMSVKLTPIYLEDVYMTGIVAERASIRRLNHALMRNIPVQVNACTFRKLMTSHKHKPADIIKLWDLVYNEPSSPCNTGISAGKSGANSGSSDTKKGVGVSSMTQSQASEALKASHEQQSSNKKS